MYGQLLGTSTHLRAGSCELLAHGLCAIYCQGVPLRELHHGRKTLRHALPSRAFQPMQRPWRVPVQLRDVCV